MEARGPDDRRKVEIIFERATSVMDVGIRLWTVGVGWCEKKHDLEPRHLQQDGYVLSSRVRC